MASSKCGLVVVEALAKAAEMILLSRVLRPSELSRSAGRTRFNVEVDEVDIVRGLIEYWRRDLCLPFVIFVVWRPPGDNPTQLLERWELRYTAAAPGGRLVDESAALVSVRSLWKRLVILLRTLYSVAVSLPSARLSRQAEVDSRRGGDVNHGSVGFALCTREIDSDGWLVLNGHASPAYEATPPMHFHGEVKSMTLPTARCIFGSLTMRVCYALRHTPLPQLPKLGICGTDSRGTSPPRTLSGLSILLARTPNTTNSTALQSQVLSKVSARATSTKLCLSGMPMARTACASSFDVSVPLEVQKRSTTTTSSLSLGPQSLDDANWRSRSCAAQTSSGTHDAPFGLALAASTGMTASGDATALHLGCDLLPRATAAAASTPPFATSFLHSASNVEGMPPSLCQQHLSPSTGSPPFAALITQSICHTCPCTGPLAIDFPRDTAGERYAAVQFHGNCTDGDKTAAAGKQPHTRNRSPPSFAHLEFMTPSTPPEVFTRAVKLSEQGTRGNVGVPVDFSRQPGSLALLAPLSRIKRIKAGRPRHVRALNSDHDDPLPFVLDLALENDTSRRGPLINFDTRLHSLNFGAKLTVASMIRHSCESTGGLDPVVLHASALSILCEFRKSSVFSPGHDCI